MSDHQGAESSETKDPKPQSTEVESVENQSKATHHTQPHKEDQAHFQSPPVVAEVEQQKADESPIKSADEIQKPIQQDKPSYNHETDIAQSIHVGPEPIQQTLQKQIQEPSTKYNNLQQASADVIGQSRQSSLLINTVQEGETQQQLALKSQAKETENIQTITQVKSKEEETQKQVQPTETYAEQPKLNQIQEPQQSTVTHEPLPSQPINTADNQQRQSENATIEQPQASQDPQLKSVADNIATSAVAASSDPTSQTPKQTLNQATEDDFDDFRDAQIVDQSQAQKYIQRIPDYSFMFVNGLL